MISVVAGSAPAPRIDEGYLLWLAVVVFDAYVIATVAAVVSADLVRGFEGDLRQIPDPRASGRITGIDQEVPMISPVRPLLVCGLAAPVLSLATDLLGIARAAGYQPMRQSISELTAVGAPTRPLVTALSIARDGLLAAFATGVTATAGDSRALAATGGLVAANAALDAFATAALPRDYASPTWAPRNTANTVVMAAGVGCFVAAMGAGAVAVRGPFRAFSVGHSSLVRALDGPLAAAALRGRATSLDRCPGANDGVLVPPVGCRAGEHVPAQAIPVAIGRPAVRR